MTRPHLDKHLLTPINAHMQINGIPLPAVQGQYWKDNYVYVLRLADECWYIGQTYQLATRLKGHFGAGVSVWTRAHKPLEVVELHWGNKLLENAKTLEYMGVFGVDKVRGGRWCSLVLPLRTLDGLIPKIQRLCPLAPQPIGTTKPL